MNRNLSFSLAALLLMGAGPGWAGAQSAPVATRKPTPPNLEIRAIYFTGLMAGSPHGKQIAEQWRAEGGNAIVFDIKDSDGPVSFNANLPLSGHMRRPYIANLAEWVNWLHEHGLYVIARQAVFKDQRLVLEHPDLAVQSRSTGKSWIETGTKPTWADPSLPAVQDYNIKLATEVAQSGVDEIQFDYIRFPVDGHQKDARFAYQATHPDTPRADFISNYLYRAQQALKPYGVHISIDVYGVMAWDRAVDLRATGQDVVSLAYFCDVECPMIYPSHFFNFDGYKDPGDAPEHFIQAGMERFNAITQDTGVVIRPWLQGFGWRTKTFSPEYVRIQVATERANHGGGFMIWNAGNKYQVTNEAMPAMVAGGSKYFLGGFPYPVTAAATAAAPAAKGRP